MDQVIYLTEEDVILINHTVIEIFSPGEMTGVRDRGLLQSALARPQQTIFGKDAYESYYLKAAALFQSLTQNHSMHNANKRTGFTALDHFLYYNGFELQMNPEDAVEFTVDVVLKKLDLDQIGEIIEHHTKAK